MRVPVTVIIPTMNRPESLERTLKYLYEGVATPDQVVVIDQSQTQEIRDANQRVLEVYKDFGVYLYEYQQIPSSTKARNVGMSRAINEIVVFSDDDIDINKNTLKNVYSIMQDETIAMIAGIDEFTLPSSTNIGYVLGTKSYCKRNIGHVSLSMLGRYPDKIEKRTETEWAMGYFFVVRKSLIDKWNCRWDENLTSYAYAEDLDFSYTYYKYANTEGYKCILDPSVKVKHLATKEYRIPGAKSIYMYIINRMYLSHKHHGGFAGFVACYWCNFCRLIQSVFYHQNARVYAKAILCSLRYRKYIYSGNLYYDKFMNL